MGAGAKTTTFLLSGLFLVVLALGGFWLLRDTQPQMCPICDRSIHPQARAVLQIDGLRTPVCCIRCGLTHNVQVGKPGQLLEVTEFYSLRPLKPESAFYVEGPRFSLCDPHDHPMVDETKHPYARMFDRCEPSTYAFARRDEAEKFARENGGTVLSWDELRKEVETKP
jgi:hypothetical protein